jgi:hypothetical protein
VRLRWFHPRLKEAHHGKHQRAFRSGLDLYGAVLIGRHLDGRSLGSLDGDRPSNSRVAILEIRLGQYTQFGDAKAGVQSLQIMTGSTATSTGASITPLNVDGHTGASTGKTVVSGPTTGILSTASSVVRLADAWNVAAGWFYSRPSFVPQMAIILKTSETMNLRMLTPNEALTMNATIRDWPLAPNPALPA